jgi:hypothetical protein
MLAAVLTVLGITKIYTYRTQMLKKPRKKGNRKAPAPFTSIHAKPAAVIT